MSLKVCVDALTEINHFRVRFQTNSRHIEKTVEVESGNKRSRDLEMPSRRACRRSRPRHLNRVSGGRRPPAFAGGLPNTHPGLSARRGANPRPAPRRAPAISHAVNIFRPSNLSLCADRVYSSVAYFPYGGSTYAAFFKRAAAPRREFRRAPRTSATPTHAGRRDAAGRGGGGPGARFRARHSPVSGVDPRRLLRVVVDEVHLAVVVPGELPSVGQRQLAVLAPRHILHRTRASAINPCENVPAVTGTHTLTARPCWIPHYHERSCRDVTRALGQWLRAASRMECGERPQKYIIRLESTVLSDYDRSLRRAAARSNAGVRVATVTERSSPFIPRQGLVRPSVRHSLYLSRINITARTVCVRNAPGNNPRPAFRKAYERAFGRSVFW